MRIDIPEQKKLVHETRIPIRWGDMDAVGHVNNTNYVRYLEIARTDWMMNVQVGRYDNYPAETGPIIANVFCNFHRPLKFPGDVIAKLYVSGLSRCTFDSWVTMELAGNEGVIYAAGGATVVWTDFAKEQAISLPQWMRDLVA